MVFVVANSRSPIISFSRNPALLLTHKSAVHSILNSQQQKRSIFLNTNKTINEAREFFFREVNNSKRRSPIEMAKKFLEYSDKNSLTFLKTKNASTTQEKLMNERKSIQKEKHSLDPFDLSAMPIAMKRKMKLEVLQLNVQNVRLLKGKKEGDGRVKLCTYDLSYYHPELRQQDVDHYIKQETWKSVRKEQDDRAKEDKRKKKKTEAEDNGAKTNSFVQTLRKAAELEVRSDPEEYQLMQKRRGLAEDQRKTIEEIKKEGSALPGIGSFDESDENQSINHRFKIKWEFYCQAVNDWEKRLNQFFPEVMGMSTKGNMFIMGTMMLMVLYYMIFGMFTSIYFKYEVVLRLQLFLSATIMSYCAGCIWGFGLGQQFLQSRLKKVPGIAATMIIVGCLFALYGALFDYNIGYMMMDATVIMNIGILLWMRYRGLGQFWHTQYMIPLLSLCLVSMLIGQYRSKKLIAKADIDIEEGNLDDYFSITSMVKSITPQWIQEIMFYDEKETVTEEEDYMNHEIHDNPEKHEES